MVRATALLVAAALAFTACGDGGSDTAGPSPIEEILGEDVFGFGDPEDFEARMVAEERERQEVIATCMQAEGFEYTPVDPSQFFGFGGEDGLEPGSDEWVARYGFGVSTQEYGQSQVGPDLVGFDDSFIQNLDADSDPNSTYYQSLPEADRKAYDEALYGGDDAFPTFDDTLSEEEIEAEMENFDFQPQGCQGEAFSAGNSAFAFYDAFGDDLEEMFERIEADPRVLEAEQKVADCVAERGLTFTGFDDAEDAIREELEQIDGPSGPFGAMTEDDIAEFEEMSEEEQEAFFNQGPPELSDADKQLLGDIQTREIELATAASDCGGSQQDQLALFQELRIEYEQEFVDANADRLAEFSEGG
ncbi:MAG: hypothetical protein AAGD35_15360 [Actinomycetota bacterium]